MPVSLRFKDVRDLPKVTELLSERGNPGLCDSRAPCSKLDAIHLLRAVPAERSLLKGNWRITTLSFAVDRSKISISLGLKGAAIPKLQGDSLIVCKFLQMNGTAEINLQFIPFLLLIPLC